MASSVSNNSFDTSVTSILDARLSNTTYSTQKLFDGEKTTVNESKPPKTKNDLILEGLRQKVYEQIQIKRNLYFDKNIQDYVVGEEIAEGKVLRLYNDLYLSPINKIVECLKDNIAQIKSYCAENNIFLLGQENQNLKILTILSGTLLAMGVIVVSIFNPYSLAAITSLFPMVGAWLAQFGIWTILTTNPIVLFIVLSVFVLSLIGLIVGLILIKQNQNAKPVEFRYYNTDQSLDLDSDFNNKINLGKLSNAELYVSKTDFENKIELMQKIQEEFQNNLAKQDLTKDFINKFNKLLLERINIMTCDELRKTFNEKDNNQLSYVHIKTINDYLNSNLK
jgi:hypothetical protein